VAVSLLLLITFPLHLFFVNNPFGFLKNCIHILFAKKTWIGYSFFNPQLPKLREGVLISNGSEKTKSHVLPLDSLQLIDYWYARDYRPMQDITTVFKNYRRLGS
jgi:hypothetical protein